MSAAERMRRYRTRRRDAGMRVVARWVSEEAVACPPYSDHRHLEARSLALHCAIARKIEADSSLLDKARRNLQAWEAGCRDGVPRPLLEWKRLLDLPWPSLAAILTGMDDRSIALRQSSPFAGILSAAERRRIYDAFRA